MITRFRVEGQHEDKELLMDQLQSAALRLMTLAREEKGISEVDHEGMWECTDDRIEGRPGNYRGRMVFVFDEHGL